MTSASRLLAVFGLAALAVSLSAQEKFIDVRQNMADRLTAAKAAAASGDWEAAAAGLRDADDAWRNDVKPLILDGVKGDPQYQEYAGRISEVEASLMAAARAVEAADRAGFEAGVNAAVWGISHHPRGFSVPKPRYTVWDWVFALGIGIGFCIFAVWFGLYLRRSYYRRFPKARFIGK